MKCSAMSACPTGGVARGTSTPNRQFRDHRGVARSADGLLLAPRMMAARTGRPHCRSPATSRDAAVTNKRFSYLPIRVPFSVAP